MKPMPSWLGWVAAVIAIYLCLLLPDNPETFSLARLPLELPVILLMALLIPARAWRILTPFLTAALTILVVLKIANFIVLTTFGRPFALVTDIPLIPIALGTMARSNAALPIAAVIGTLVIVGPLAFAVYRALIVLGRSRTLPILAAGAVLATAAIDLALFVPDHAHADTAEFAKEEIASVVNDLADTARFKQIMAAPLFPAASSPEELAGLKGTDVLVIFAESYGRSALERAPIAAGVQETLRAVQQDLSAAGFHAASAWATSPTYGGGSWLAHSTLLSGLPVTSQARFQALVRSDRSTLSRDFERAGWRTMALMPEITGGWPEGKYFGFTDAFTAPEIGYRGPSFGYVTMPDQFVLKTFADKALGQGHKPVMATIALVSSHIPWVPIPKMVPWDQVGDGGIFAAARTTDVLEDVWRDPTKVAPYYGKSIEYVLRAVTSFITTYGNDHTLVIFLGDHQPISLIAGDLNHDVPIHIIAHDPTLLRAFTKDQWTDGMIPNASSPVVPMDALRAQLTNTFTPENGR